MPNTIRSRALALAMALGLAYAYPVSAVERDLRAALMDGQDYAAADNALAAVDRAFRGGRAGEYDLLEAYKPFYADDERLAAALDAWVRAQPASVPARLARGTYLRKRGEAVHGLPDVRTVVPHDKLVEAERLFRLSAEDLHAAQKIDPSCYLAELGLMNIATYLNDEAEADRQVAAAEHDWPANLLVRARYMVHLIPRYGGSYPKMEAFVARSGRTGASTQTLDLLQAIELDSQGSDARRSGDLAAAKVDFQRARTLAREVDPRFIQTYLPFDDCNC